MWAWASASSPKPASCWISLGCKGVVVWCLEDNHAAVEFYRFQGGRDVAEGHETFDGKSLKKLAFVWS